MPNRNCALLTAIFPSRNFDCWTCCTLHAAGSIPENVTPSHHDSAAAQPQQHRLIRQPLCKYWVNTGRCLRGDMCDYQHVKPSQLPELRQGWVTARYHQSPAANADCALCNNGAFRQCEKPEAYACKYYIQGPCPLPLQHVSMVMTCSISC